MTFLDIASKDFMMLGNTYVKSLNHRIRKTIFSQCLAMMDLIKTYIIILRNLPCPTSIIKCINKRVCLFYFLLLFR